MSTDRNSGEGSGVAPPARDARRPKVSVVCAWYDRADHIGETLDSLLAQDFDGFEIVLVDDGSPDPRVREILDRYDDPRLRVVHQDNTGFTLAIRRAIDAARGEYIAIQGAGDVSLPQRLRVQAAVLDRESEVGVVGCRYENVVVGGPGDRLRTLSAPRTLAPRLEHLVKGRNPLGHGEVMMRRSVYDAVGGYRPFFRFAQDRDLWIRMAPICRFRIVDELLYERRVFQKDGVSADRSKLLLQQALSNFARQCHHDRRENGRDYVDIYGAHAGLFRRPAPEFADFCARQALQAFAIDDADNAAFFCTMAWREKKTPFVLLAACCVALSSKSRLFARLVRGRLLQHKGAARWRSTKHIAR